jgi:hypothetical protein
MKLNKWTVALTAAGVVSAASIAQAEERPMSQVLTGVSGTTIGGYVDTSAIWKFGKGTTSEGGVRTEDRLPGRFNDGSDRVDGFNLNVVGLSIGKPLGEDNWAAGYQVDLLFGPDAIGYNPSAGGAGDSDFAIKQAYVDLRLPMGTGLDFKMGVFDTIVGYESFESYLNPNFSRSYGWQLEPTQHTGLLASYQLSEAFAISAGIANTFHEGINTRSPRRESHMTYMAGIEFTAPDATGFMSGSTFSAGFVDGFNNNGRHDSTSFYVGGSLLTPIEGLRLGIAYDYLRHGETDFSPVRSSAYALAGYLTFQATEKLAFSGRADWMRGSNGTFYDTGTGEKNKLFAATITAEYALWANVITRAEFRWDHAISDYRPFGREGAGDENALTLAGNVVFKF